VLLPFLLSKSAFTSDCTLAFDDDDDDDDEPGCLFSELRRYFLSARAVTSLKRVASGDDINERMMESNSRGGREAKRDDDDDDDKDDDSDDVSSRDDEGDDDNGGGSAALLELDRLFTRMEFRLVVAAAAAAFPFFWSLSSLAAFPRRRGDFLKGEAGGDDGCFLRFFAMGAPSSSSPLSSFNIISTITDDASTAPLPSTVDKEKLPRAFPA